jgi:hypothetical protein
MQERGEIKNPSEIIVIKGKKKKREKKRGLYERVCACVMGLGELLGALCKRRDDGRVSLVGLHIHTHIPKAINTELYKKKSPKYKKK